METYPFVIIIVNVYTSKGSLVSGLRTKNCSRSANVCVLRGLKTIKVPQSFTQTNSA